MWYNVTRAEPLGKRELAGASKRPKLSDPAHGTRELQPERDGRVRCSAWLGHWRDCANHAWVVLLRELEWNATQSEVLAPNLE